MEHHLYVSSDVTRTWGTVIRGGLRADVESPAMWVDWISQKQDKETNITEHRRARLGFSVPGWMVGSVHKTQTAWHSC